MGFSLFGVWSTELIPLGMIYEFAPSFPFGHGSAMSILRWPLSACFKLRGIPRRQPEGFISPLQRLFSFFIAAVFPPRFWIVFSYLAGSRHKKKTVAHGRRKSSIMPKKSRPGYTGLAESILPESTVFVRQSSCERLHPPPPFLKECWTFSSWLRRLVFFFFWKLWPFTGPRPGFYLATFGAGLDAGSD